MFTDIKDNITRRFREIKMWVESVPDEQGLNEFQSTSYGLFFVYLYGIYEELIRNTVSRTILELNNSSVKIDKCIFSLYSLLFASEYDSMYGVSSEHKWEKRWEVSNKLIQNPNIAISNDLFPTDGRNIKVRQLTSLSNSFGIQDAVLPRNEIGGYIDEMVANRNNIAHGNKLPKEVGRSYTKDDLILRCDNISEICSYVCSVYESYIQEQKYMR